MDDEPDIRAIDAHAECYGGDDDVDLLFEECVLVPMPLTVVQSRVVRTCAYPGLAEPRRQCIDFAPRRAIDDASFAALRTSSGAVLPKGLTRETLDRVRAAMRDAPAGAMSAAELAAALDLSRVTARRYLEHLADTGVVGRAGRYGSPGRPEVEYRQR